VALRATRDGEGWTLDGVKRFVLDGGVADTLVAATLFSIITNLLHFGMVVVGLDYGYAGQMTLNEIWGGSPYGVTTIAGVIGSNKPTENELNGARYQGRKIPEVANKLLG
jgi:multimeric flavodoxin WrbA